MIRKYLQEDKEKVLDIFDLNVPKFFDPTEKVELDDYLEKEANTYRVIEIDNAIVGGFGFIIAKDNSEASVTWIFFDPNQTGKGLGKLAVNYCHDLFLNTYNIQKFTIRTSQLANTFFEKFGYKTVYTEKNYWGEGLDLYAMERLLDLSRSLD